jgi:broad specificity phosphatase PhoE
MKLRNHYFILRHGQTIYQAKKERFTYPPLSENIAVKLTNKGEKQIKIAAKSLKKTGIDLIFSSDFFRTRQTSKIVAKKLGIKKITLDKRLRDINLGIYHGGLEKDFYRDFPSEAKDRFNKKPKKGESWNEVIKRMLGVLREIERKYKEKKILIVSHGDPLWLLEGTVKNWSETKLLKHRKIDYIKVGELRQL